MEKHVYDYAGHTRSLHRSNLTLKNQLENALKKPTAKRCIFVWIGIIIGCVASGKILYTVVKYGRVLPDRKVDIRFDPTTLYSKCYLSHNDTILSNRHTDRTSYNPNLESRFQNYQGAMVNTCVENSTSIYFNIYFQYVVSSNLSDGNLILELGIAERNKIDNYYYVGSSHVNGWSFHLYNCIIYNKVCLRAENQPQGTMNVISQFSNNTTGTTVNGTFAILIDRERNRFSLFYNDTVHFTFRDVLSNVSLCPVFGVYNPVMYKLICKLCLLET